MYEYICIYICIYMYIYVYIHVYTYTTPHRDTPQDPPSLAPQKTSLMPHHGLSNIFCRHCTTCLSLSTCSYIYVYG